MHLKVDFDWTYKPLYNVIARIPGSTFPDEWIIYGNHHDAWVNGADDPVSGAVALLETARGLSSCCKTGWQPSARMMFALWDGEECGLLGSTEWVEKHAAELRDKAAVYINTDSTGKGWLSAGGSHGLQQFLNEVARDIPDPRTGKPIVEEARRRAVMRTPEADRGRARGRMPALRLEPLGSGSDFTPFLQHLTFSSLNVGFGGESAAASITRSTTRELVLEVLGRRFPLRPDAGADDGHAGCCGWRTRRCCRSSSATRPTRCCATWSSSRSCRNEEGRERRSRAGACGGGRAQARGTGLRAAYARWHGRRRRPAGRQELRAVNQLLMQSERGSATATGCRGDWFKHQIYAPGFYTGYGVKTMPQIREGLEEGPLRRGAGRRAHGVGCRQRPGRVTCRTPRRRCKRHRGRGLLRPQPGAAPWPASTPLLAFSAIAQAIPVRTDGDFGEPARRFPNVFARHHPCSSRPPLPEASMETRDGFILGIFNYCDRWCERCTLSGRCSVFAEEQRMVFGAPSSFSGAMPPSRSPRRRRGRVRRQSTRRGRRSSAGRGLPPPRRTDVHGRGGRFPPPRQRTGAEAVGMAGAGGPGQRTGGRRGRGGGAALRLLHRSQGLSSPDRPRRHREDGRRAATPLARPRRRSGLRPASARPGCAWPNSGPSTCRGRARAHRTAATDDGARIGCSRARGASCGPASTSRPRWRCWSGANGGRDVSLKSWVLGRGA